MCLLAAVLLSPRTDVSSRHHRACEKLRSLTIICLMRARPHAAKKNRASDRAAMRRLSHFGRERAFPLPQAGTERRWISKKPGRMQPFVRRLANKRAWPPVARRLHMRRNKEVRR
jgi:hypothetical protein